VELLDKMWDEWIGELQGQLHCDHFELGDSTHLSDAMRELLP